MERAIPLIEHASNALVHWAQEEEGEEEEGEEEEEEGRREGERVFNDTLWDPGRLRLRNTCH